MQSIIINNYLSPCGELIIGSYEDKLCLCDWRYRQKREAVDSRIQEGLKTRYQAGNSFVIEQTIAQLDEYFQKKRTSFDISLLMVGTDFQKGVWKALIDIPYGEKETYMGLALKMNNPKAVRAIASANGANAISIIIPCHRIIGSDNKLVGYAGGVAAKKDLLELEFETTKQLSLF